MYTIRHKTSKVHHSLCVGILTIPHSKKTKYGRSHIMKAYVDWFEERGVRVIPIPYDTTEPEMYFNMINGLFIPGGDTPYIIQQMPFFDTVVRFFELSFQQDEYFPIWGTCFGFEMLMFVVGGFTKLKRYDAHGLFPISITRSGKRSRLFGSIRRTHPQYLNYLETHKSTSQNHEYGISTGDFLENDNLRRFYNILATSVGEDGKECVAAIEAKYYPIYGVQWHPERQRTAGHFVDFFISELRKNRHRCFSLNQRQGQGQGQGHSLIPIHTRMRAHKCIQYPEHKDLLCYFF